MPASRVPSRASSAKARRAGEERLVDLPHLLAGRLGAGRPVEAAHLLQQRRHGLRVFRNGGRDGDHWPEISFGSPAGCISSSSNSRTAAAGR